METVVNSNGRIVIPAHIRRELGIKAGTYLQIEVDIPTKRIILTPITREFIHSLRGRYKGSGLMKSLADEKKRARKL